MSNQQSQKKILVESIKQSMIKPPSTLKKSITKKPQNYDSYLNTAIDYSKNHDNSQTDHTSSLKKSQLVYNLDSDDSPKEEQQTKNHQNFDEIYVDEEMMNQIEMEIMRETTKGQDSSPVQRKIIKPLGPKRKSNQTNEVEDGQAESKIPQKPSLTKAQKTARGATTLSVKNYDDEEQTKIIAQEGQKSKKRMMVTGKTSASLNSQMPPIPVQSNASKKLKQSLSETSRPLKFSVDIALLNGGHEIERITDIRGSTREDIRYVCRTLEGESVQLNNVEMTHLYKDVLVDYYQNILFTEEQTDDS